MKRVQNIKKYSFLCLIKPNCVKKYLKSQVVRAQQTVLDSSTNQGSISSTFYSIQITKVQKKTNGLTSFFALLGSGDDAIKQRFLIWGTPNIVYSKIALQYSHFSHI